MQETYDTILGTGDPKVTIGPVTVGLTEGLTFERWGKRYKNNVVAYVDYTFALACTVLFANHLFLFSLLIEPVSSLKATILSYLPL